MAQFKWVRKNLCSKTSPLYVYECEDHKVAMDYAAFNPTELGMELQVNMFRVVHNCEGWEVLKWDWSVVHGGMRYIRFGGSWGWKRKYEAIEDAEYAIERIREWNK